MDNYIQYHIHDDTSLLDSCTKFSDYVYKAVELGQKALASTNHGTLYNWEERLELCDKAGIKYIHGCEVYLTEKLWFDPVIDMESPEFKKMSEEQINVYIAEHQRHVRDNYHTVLLARNTEGLKEINSLVSISTNKEHMYHKPRISFDEFFNISDNVIKISACLASPLHRFRTECVDKNNMEETFNKLCDKYDFYEIQPHANSKEQAEYNKFLYELSKKKNKKLIVGCDVHSIDAYKEECRKILQRSKGIDFTSEDDFDLTYKSYDEILDCFNRQGALPYEVYKEALDNTNLLDEMTEHIVLDTSIKYPHMYDNDDAVMEKRTYDMLDEKVASGIIKPQDKQKYKDNIEEEFRVFRKTNMMGFMLSMSEIVSDCKKKGIAFGFGRGSCFTDSALVQCDNTLKSIKDVKVGDKVLSHDGKFHTVYETQRYNVNEPVVEFAYEHQGSSYKKYKNICTLDHRILVHRNNQNLYVSAKDIKSGDLLCCPKIKTEEYSDIVIDLNKYNVFGYDFDDNYIYEKKGASNSYKYSPTWMEEHGIANRTMIKRIANGHTPSSAILSVIMENIPFKTLDDYRAYMNKHKYNCVSIRRYIKLNALLNSFIGMMYGDGWTEKEVGLGLAINHTTKNVFNRYVFTKIAEYFGLDVTENISKNGKNLSQLCIHSKILNNFFRTEFFCSQRGVDKKFNVNLLNQNKKNISCLYNGLMRTDGSYGKNNKVSFDNTSMSLVSAVKIMSNMLGHEPSALDIRLEHCDKRGWINKESYKVRYSSNRKYNKILNDNDYWYLKINNIQKYNYSGYVYDISVKDSESFVINNIVVHNCGGSTVAYVTDITDIDPVRWNTVFSRFCNEDRVEIGD